MLISKVSGFGFNGKNINPKKVQSAAENVYSFGANLEESLLSNGVKEATSEVSTYYPFSSSVGNGYLEKPLKNTQDQFRDEAHEYLSASMILEKDTKKKV